MVERKVPRFQVIELNRLEQQLISVEFVNKANIIMPKMHFKAFTLSLARPFTIARGTRTTLDVVRVTLEEDGFIGFGESTPMPRFNESAESVSAQLSLLQPKVEAGLTREQLQSLLPAGAARNAIDCAYWRLEAAMQRKTLWQLLDKIAPKSVTTAETVCIDTVENMANAAKEAISRGVNLLKIKLNRDEILEKVAAIRNVAPNATLIIDANESWSNIDLVGLFDSLKKYNIKMIEQPLPADRDSDLQHFHHVIPVCADESCHRVGDIVGLRNRYEMINIKLDKCGGLTEALTMVADAERYNMRIMIGCMLGSSLAMEAALPLTISAEFVDLDGPIWLAEDISPFLCFKNGRIWL